MQLQNAYFLKAGSIPPPKQEFVTKQKKIPYVSYQNNRSLNSTKPTKKAQYNSFSDNQLLQISQASQSFMRPSSIFLQNGNHKSQFDFYSRLSAQQLYEQEKDIQKVAIQMIYQVLSKLKKDRGFTFFKQLNIYIRDKAEEEQHIVLKVTINFIYNYFIFLKNFHCGFVRLFISTRLVQTRIQRECFLKLLLERETDKHIYLTTFFQKISRKYNISIAIPYVIKNDPSEHKYISKYLFLAFKKWKLYNISSKFRYAQELRQQYLIEILSLHLNKINDQFLKRKSLVFSILKARINNNAKLNLKHVNLDRGQLPIIQIKNLNKIYRLISICQSVEERFLIMQNDVEEGKQILKLAFQKIKGNQLQYYKNPQKWQDTNLIEGCLVLTNVINTRNLSCQYEFFQLIMKSGIFIKNSVIKEINKREFVKKLHFCLKKIHERRTLDSFENLQHVKKLRTQEQIYLQFEQLLKKKITQRNFQLLRLGFLKISNSRLNKIQINQQKRRLGTLSSGFVVSTIKKLIDRRMLIALSTLRFVEKFQKISQRIQQQASNDDIIKNISLVTSKLSLKNRNKLGECIKREREQKLLVILNNKLKKTKMVQRALLKKWEYNCTFWPQQYEDYANFVNIQMNEIEYYKNEIEQIEICNNEILMLQASLNTKKTGSEVNEDSSQQKFTNISRQNISLEVRSQHEGGTQEDIVNSQGDVKIAFEYIKFLQELNFDLRNQYESNKKLIHQEQKQYQSEITILEQQIRQIINQE